MEGKRRRRGAPRPAPARSGSRSTSTPLARAMWPRSASRPSLTSIMAVAPRVAASGPASYGGIGRRCSPTRGFSRMPAVSPVLSRASPAAAWPSGPATATTSPALAPDRSTGSRPARLPRPVTASSTVAARAVSPPMTAAPARAASAASPGPGGSGPAHRQVRRRGQRQQQAGRVRAHGRQVGQAAGGGLVTGIRTRGPVPAEVPALDQEVGGGHHPAVRGGQYRGIVPDADQRPRPGGQPRGQLPDQTELAESGQCRPWYRLWPRRVLPGDTGLRHNGTYVLQVWTSTVA